MKKKNKQKKNINFALSTLFVLRIANKNVDNSKRRRKWTISIDCEIVGGKNSSRRRRPCSSSSPKTPHTRLFIILQRKKMMTMIRARQLFAIVCVLPSPSFSSGYFFTRSNCVTTGQLPHPPRIMPNQMFVSLCACL